MELMDPDDGLEKNTFIKEDRKCFHMNVNLMFTSFKIANSPLPKPLLEVRHQNPTQVSFHPHGEMLPRVQSSYNGCALL